MQSLNLDFNDVTGFDSGRTSGHVRKPKQPLKAPCNACPCEWACAGSRHEGDPPNWARAMACSAYARYAGTRQISKVDKLPSRVVFAKLFG